MDFFDSRREGVARSVVAAAIVVVVVLIVGGILYTSLQKPSSSTTASSSSSSITLTSSSSSSGSVVTTSSSSSSGSGSGTLNTLNIVSQNWPYGVDLNPQDMYGDIPYPLWSQYSTYQTLVNVNETAEYDQGIYQYVPGLASNWTVSDSGSTYTFNLRHGVTFSNGDPFNAYSLWLNNYGYYYSSGNLSAWVFGNPIFNMTGVVIGNSTFADIQANGGLSAPTGSALTMMENSAWPIYVTGPYTIVYHMDTPYPYMLGLFIGSPGLILDSQYILDHGGYGVSGTVPGNSYLDLNPPPGTGPYQFVNATEGSSVVYQENPTYWGNNLTKAQIQENPVLQAGHVKTIRITTSTDDIARYTDLTTGVAQMTELQQNLPTIEANPSGPYSFFQNPPWSANVMALAFDTQKYPTNITDFRLALSHAINYTAIDKTAFNGFISPFVGPETPGWGQFYNLTNDTNGQSYSYNTTLALQELQASGVNLKTLQPLEITQATTQGANVNLIVQADLQAIGIPSTIVVQTESVYELPYSQSNLTLRAQEAGQITIIGGGGYGPSGILTPSDPWVTFTTATGGGNWAEYNNSAVNQEVGSFYTSDNISYITSQLKLAQQEIYDTAPYAWIGVFTLTAGPAGSLVWNNHVITGFLFDPCWSGVSDLPVLNTITFANGPDTSSAEVPVGR